MEASANTAALPPQNLDAEESVLGAMMVSKAALDAVLDVRLDPEDFYRPRHQIIHRAIRVLDTRGEAIDALTVAEQLRTEGQLDEVGGADGISTLASSTSIPGNARHYAEIVRQNALLRRLLAASQKIQSSIHGREAEPRELVEQAEILLFNVARDDQSSEFSQLGDILVHETERLEKLASGESSMTGTPSGYRMLDEMTGGFQPGNLIVLAARPAMGKSSLVCNIAENVAWKAKKPVAFFSLEMSETELAHRFIASRARISSDRLRKGQVSKQWNKVLKACNELTEAPLWIDDSSDLSMMDLRAKARRLMSSSGGLGLIIVDYIQLMRPDDPRAGRVEQVGQMSRGLKVLARELEVPVIALSQLSRAPEQRPDKVPMLADLRESGCLTGDTRVQLPDEGRSVPLAELVEDGAGVGKRVLALNEETWRLEPRAITNAFPTGSKQTYRLTTRLGRTIRATANHRFRTVDGWRRLDQLAGEQIALPRLLPGGPVQTIRQEMPRLHEHVGSVPGRRRVAGAEVAALLRDRSQSTNRDILPRDGWHSRVQPAIASSGVTTRQSQPRVGVQCCGSTLHKANLSRERAARVADTVSGDELRQLAESDVCWDRVVSIEPDGTEVVYDLTVEGAHNFVADDVVVHNSIEQDADIVAFIYRDDYYNPEDSDRPGEADLVIAKHRNGPVGKVALAFQAQYPRFISLSREDEARAGDMAAEAA